jgi:hypothetical protein
MLGHKELRDCMNTINHGKIVTGQSKANVEFVKCFRLSSYHSSRTL